MTGAAAVGIAFLALGLSWMRPAQEGRSSYAGDERRAIKALSEEEVRAYLAGDGMGLARAAELNRYPGPRHVLDLADRLELTPAQRAAVESARERMRAEASRLGVEIVEKERALDTRFASGAVTETELRDAVARIARLQGELRAAHLAAHLATRSALKPAQVDRYVRLRGYAEHAGH